MIFRRPCFAEPEDDGNRFPPFERNYKAKGMGKQVPSYENDVPHFGHKIPPESAGNAASVPNQNTLTAEKVPRTEDKRAMPNTQPEINSFVKEHIREIMPFLRKRCEEKGLKNEELMIATGIPHTTFYRIWKIGTPEEEKQRDGRPYIPDPDNVCRLCLAIGASLDEFQRVPTADSSVFLPALSEQSHEKVIDNMWGEVAKNREAAENLESEKSDLLDKNAELEEALRQTREELRKCRERIDQLTDSLIERHDQMHEISRQHEERVERLGEALCKQYERIYKLSSGSSAEKED